ncbi:MAG: T9SS type A sorting domain-containing protein [bacterium]|nr:T9SS type A sorting domain-containing protein [bacterium]
MKQITTLLLCFTCLSPLFAQLNNDLGFTKHDVLVPPLSTDFHKMFDGFPIGGTFYNYGTANQDSVYISVSITSSNGFNFQDAIGPLTINAGDSIRIFQGESNEFSPFSFAPNSVNFGDYELIYRVQIENDQNTSNDSLVLPFILWNSEYHTIAPSGIQPNEQRLHQIYPKPSSAVSYQACVVWEDSNEAFFVSNPYPYQMTHVDIVPHVDSGETIAGAEIFINVFDWSDSWQNIDDSSFQSVNGAFQNLQLLGFGTYYPSSDDENDSTISVSLQSIVIQNDFTRYLICAQTFEDPVKFGFDTTTSFQTNFNEIKQPIGVIQSNSDWELVEPTMVPAVAPRFNLVTGVGEMEKEALFESVVCYPSPAGTDLYLKTDAANPIKVIISDAQGREVNAIEFNPTNSEQQIDISMLHPGHYFISATFVSGNQKLARFIKQ